ncbi:MAG: hypothetical protein GJ680_17710 [Alteromonadaceae bacterium]|nr:hypothetical protein [Alteromonadaceae bacterium]
MKFNSGTNAEILAEKINYTDYPGTNHPDTPPAPRCGLDFYIELDDGTRIDDQTLRLQNFSGQEQLSQMFDFNLTLRANAFFSSGLDKPWGDYQQGPYGKKLKEGGKTTEKLDFKKILGAKACIRLGLPETYKDIYESDYPEHRPVIYFNGIITNFSLAERGVYTANLKPALFKLQLQNNYRLFSQMTIIEVIMEILSENNIDFNKKELEKQPNKIVCGLANYRKQDWLQAGETDFDFIHRLMNKVDLFYYFEHSDEKHTMIITDQPHYKPICSYKYKKNSKSKETHDIKPLYLSYTKQQTLERDDYITQFSYKQNLTAAGIKTVLAQKEATWESQNTAKATPVFMNQANAAEKMNMEFLHVVQYGASETEINHLTNNTMNRLLASRFEFSGSSSCPELKAGHKFLVKERDGKGDEYSVPICPTIDGEEFVVTSVQHNASAAGDYSNQFQAVDANGLASPFSPPQENQGSILALVVDNSGATDYEGTSAKYLEKDGFSYDKKDFQYDDQGEQKYSCRGIHVTFIDDPDNTIHWVKLSESMQTIPETGAFVTISRSSDANEIPEVQQIMQNKGNKCIMPDDFTCSTNVGNNYSTSYGDSTSISFGSNVKTPLTKAKNIVEKQRGSNNYNSVSYSESSSFGYSVTERSHNVSRTGKGPDQNADPSNKMSYVSYSDSAMYGDSYSKNKHVGKSTSYSKQIGGTYSESKQTGGSVSVSEIDTSNSKSTVGMSNSHSEVGMSNSFSMTGSSNSLSLTGMSVGTSITGLSTGVSITGVSANMGLVGVSSSMNLTGSSSSLSLTGSQSGLSLTGSSTNLSLTGSSSSLSLTGVSSGLSLTGASSSLGLTGSSSNLSLTGSSSGISLTGSSTGINLTGSSTSISLTGSSTNISLNGSSTSINIHGNSTNINIGPAGVNINIDPLDLQMLSSIKLVM